jgi:hypothetical protein
MVAVFTIWHILLALRPDLEIHILLENAGSMSEDSRRWIFEAMNISPLGAPTTDAGPWSGFTRRRKHSPGDPRSDHTVTAHAMGPRLGAPTPGPPPTHATLQRARTPSQHLPIHGTPPRLSP